MKCRPRLPTMNALAQSILMCHMRLRICSLLLTLALFVAPGFAQRLDHDGDPLPQGAERRLGSVRLHSVCGFAWTPDGKSIVTVRDGEARFIELATGKLQKSLQVPIGSLYGSGLAITADGKRLVCADREGAIAMWGLAENRLVPRPAREVGKWEENIALAFLPDGQTFVTVRAAAELEFRRTETCEVYRTDRLPAGNWGNKTWLAVSPDGQTIALAPWGSHAISLVSVKTPGELAVIKEAHDYLDSLAFLPDGRLISSGRKGLDLVAGLLENLKDQIRIWDVKTLQKLVEWPVDDKLTPWCMLAPSPDGTTLMAVHGDRLVIWDVATQKIRHSVPYFFGWFPGELSVDPKGKYFAIDTGHKVRLWEIATGKPALASDQPMLGVPGIAAWSLDGKRVATAAQDLEFCIWNAASGEQLVKFMGPWATSLAFIDGGQRLLVEGWDARPGAPRQQDHVVQWRDAATGKLEREVRLQDRAGRMALSPNGRKFALRTGEAFDLLETSSGKKLRSLEGTLTGIVTLDWTADGEFFLSLDRDGKVVRTKATTGEKSESTLVHRKFDEAKGELVPARVYHAAFFRDGKTAITIAGAQVSAWNLVDGNARWSFGVETQSLHAMALSPDDKTLALSVNLGNGLAKCLRLYDVATQRELAQFDLGQDPCWALRFSPDRSKLLACLSTTSVIYDVAAVRDLPK